MVQVAAHKIHQPGHRRLRGGPAFAHGAAERAGAVVEIDGFVSVGVDGAAQPFADFGEGFVPTDALELAFPAFADPAQGVGNTFLGIHALAHGTPARAGAELLQTVLVVAGIVRFYLGDDAVAHMHAQGATAPAIHIAGVPEDFPLSRARWDGRSGQGLTRVENLYGKREERRCKHSGSSLDDIAPLQDIFFF